MTTKTLRASWYTTLIFTWAGCLIAQTAPTPLRVAASSPANQETEQPFADLEGIAESDSGLANVIWVDQFGNRGTGVWTYDQRLSHWTVNNVPLRLGLNRITVTAVDINNESDSVHFAINRQLPPGADDPKPIEVRNGVWRGRPVTYAVSDGNAVVEGDIIVGSAADIETPGLAINYKSQLWPAVNGVYQVPYVIQSGSANLTQAISAFNNTFAGLIQFVARTSQSNYVNIDVTSGFYAGEGYSWVGMKGGEQQLTCSTSCAVTTFLHEMGHTIGLLHEHQRPDRNTFIEFNQANADLPNVANNFTFFTYDYQVIGLYDYASVMHYPPFSLSKNNLAVLESIPAGIPLSNNNGYSIGDIDQGKRLYSAAPSLITVTTNPTGLSIIVDGTTYTAPHTFSWTLNSTHTLNVPSGAQNVNPPDGSTYAFARWNTGTSMAAEQSITIQGGTGALASPANKPAATVYQANFVRLQPFTMPSVYPSGAASISVCPAPVSEYGGTFFTDRQLVVLILTPNAGNNFYDWYHMPSPPSDNPKSFLIQSPTTTGQAVFVSTAVTTIGESLTGPTTFQCATRSNTWNLTWNPGLFGYVDGSWTGLPTGFSETYNGSSWDSGTTHSITVTSPQSPVTTNVYYTWDSWSDKGALTHNIIQPASGAQTIVASLTPSYRYYSLASPSCGGTVGLTPTGQTLNSLTYYQDGIDVTATATANSQYPGFIFAGWSGSLSGSTNPQSHVIHDQFIPTANFNTVATPITVTSYSPATAAATSSALNLTINGTGFTSQTYTYWNNSYRASTFVNSTQLIMHLNAGDLASAGGQDVFVGNYVTNSSNSTCGATFESSFTVTVVGLSANPAAVAFGNQNMGSKSAGYAVVLSNVGDTTLSGVAVSITGADITDFTQANNCPASLASGASCTVTITFAPQASGTRSATLAAAYSGVGSPLDVPLAGIGQPASLSPASIAFGAETVGVTSAPETLTLANVSGKTLNISSIAVTGADSGDFAQTHNCGTSLGAGLSCQISVTFTPKAKGTRVGAITVTDGSPPATQTASLSGTGD